MGRWRVAGGLEAGKTEARRVPVGVDADDAAELAAIRAAEANAAAQVRGGGGPVASDAAPIPSDVAERLEALEEAIARITDHLERSAQQAGTRTAPVAPSPTAPVDPLRPSAPTIAEWSRAAHAVAKRAGAWSAESDPRDGLGRAVQDLGVAFGEVAAGLAPDFLAAEPSGRPIGPAATLARVVLGVLDLAVAFGIDLETGLQLVHEHQISAGAEARPT